MRIVSLERRQLLFYVEREWGFKVELCSFLDSG
jgi:hypothetical protein